MQLCRYLVILIAAIIFATPAYAGLYYSGEVIAELPSKWQGFLLDQRTLRNIAVPPSARVLASPARKKYQAAAAELEKISRDRKLTAEEQADLGAIYLRLGETERALQILRSAQREHTQDFRVAANLGTAWQMQGDLQQAVNCLREAVRLAPVNHKQTEEYHLKLVQLRQRQRGSEPTLDDLFGVRYVGANGEYEPGKLADAEKNKLPADAVAIVQQLALWLPADGQLLWQLAELANAHGDIRMAAAIMDGCVTEFAMSAPELRQHRKLLRSVAEELTKMSAADVKAVHERHAETFTTRSKRPLKTRIDQQPLPPVRTDGMNALPWSVLGDTAIERRSKPSFPKYLQEVNGREVALTGFMHPLDDQPEVSAFLLVEYPIGCWFCEMPEMTGIIMVALAGEKSTPHTRGLIKIEGTLNLNASDPESFLYTISNASVKEAD